MSPDAAQELLGLIMLDDFVERRAALDRWSRRWLATVHVEFDGPEEQARHSLLFEVTRALVADECNVLSWGKRLDLPGTIQLEMNCVRRTPLEGV